MVRLWLRRLQIGRVHCCQITPKDVEGQLTLRCLLRSRELMVLMLLLLVVHPWSPWSTRTARTARSPLYWPRPIRRVRPVLHVRREELRIFCR